MTDENLSEQKELLLEEAEDEKNVIDEAESEFHETVRFTITAYGADPSVFDLVRRMNSERLITPTFQRAYVWSSRDASRFIETLLMGLPVPGIFVFKDVANDEDLIIDGQQRLLTLKYFMGGILRGKEFRLTDVAKPWNGQLFTELEQSERSRIEEATIHVTYFKQDSPQENDRSIYEVFERINTGGLKLSAQEIRTCVSHGTFVSFLNGLNQNSNWRKIYGKPSPRLKDIELILRFLALKYERGSYHRPMRKFLDDFLKKYRHLNSPPDASFGDTFKRTIDLVERAIGKRAFRPASALNAAVFDAIMIGLAERIDKVGASEPDLIKVREVYDGLLEDPSFKAAYVRATADEESVKTRINLAVKQFGQI